MNIELILLAVCYRHHWYLQQNLSATEEPLSSRAGRKEEEKEEEEKEARGGRIFPNKSLRHGIRNRMYALRGQRARYSLIDRRWSIHLTWRSVTRFEYLDRKNRKENEKKKKTKRNWKKSREKSFYILSCICGKSGTMHVETKISICVDMHPRESSLVALVMHRSRCCVFFDNETGRTGQL